MTSGSIDTTTGAASGTTDLAIISDTAITKGTGEFIGTFSSDYKWTGTDTGTGLTNEPFTFSGNWSSFSFWDYSTELYEPNEDKTGSYGFVGLVDRGNYYDYVLMGPYLNSSAGGPYSSLSYIYDYDVVDQDFDYPGLSGMIWDNGKFKGILAATYDELGTDDTAGIFYQELSGIYREIPIYYYTGMWISKGEIAPVEMTSGITSSGRYVDYTYPDMYPLYFTDYWGEGSPYLNYGYYSTDSGNGTSITTVIKNQDGSLDMIFGVWSLGLVGGGYYGTPADGWTLLLEDGYDEYDFDTIGYVEIGGTVDSTWNWTTNEISASVAGSWVELGNNLTTGISGGRLIGTFDATNEVWQAVAGGSLMDTNTFLDMAATDAGRVKLMQLDIPCIEVGSTTLSGSYVPDMGGPATWEVTMTNVEFFAYSMGAAPKIWATCS